MSPFDPTAVTGTPFGAPLVPPLPIRLRRTEILTIVYRTDPEAADALIPAPLELAGDLCVVHVYRMHDAEWFGVYCESACAAPGADAGRHRGGRTRRSWCSGRTAPWPPGVRRTGSRRRPGQVSLEPNGDLLVGRVARNGIEIATATMCWKQDAVERRRAGAAGRGVWRQRQPAACARRRVTRSAASWSRATSRTSSSTRPGPGPGTLELRANAQAPVHLLPVREVVLALHRVIDLTLAAGPRRAPVLGWI